MASPLWCVASMSMVRALSALEASLAVSVQFKKHVSCNPAVPLSSTYAGETLERVPREVSIHVFLGTL